jgi:hypothetical protein
MGDRVYLPNICSLFWCRGVGATVRRRGVEVPACVHPSDCQPLLLLLLLLRHSCRGLRSVMTPLLSWRCHQESRRLRLPRRSSRISTTLLGHAACGASETIRNARHT